MSKKEILKNSKFNKKEKLNQKKEIIRVKTDTRFDSILDNTYTKLGVNSKN